MAHIFFPLQFPILKSAILRAQSDMIKYACHVHAQSWMKTFWDQSHGYLACLHQHVRSLLPKLLRLCLNRFFYMTTGLIFSREIDVNWRSSRKPLKRFRIFWCSFRNSDPTFLDFSARILSKSPLSAACNGPKKVIHWSFICETVVRLGSTDFSNT